MAPSTNACTYVYAVIRLYLQMSVAGYDDNLFSDYIHVSTDERGWLR